MAAVSVLAAVVKALLDALGLVHLNAMAECAAAARLIGG
jgi:hypothetical protein